MKKALAIEISASEGTNVTQLFEKAIIEHINRYGNPKENEFVSSIQLHNHLKNHSNNNNNNNYNNNDFNKHNSNDSGQCC